MSGRAARAAKRRKCKTVTRVLKEYYTTIIRSQILRESILVEKILAEMQAEQEAQA